MSTNCTWPCSRLRVDDAIALEMELRMFVRFYALLFLKKERIALSHVS